MQPTIARWLFIALIALVIWRLIPLSTEQELLASCVTSADTTPAVDLVAPLLVLSQHVPPL